MVGGERLSGPSTSSSVCRGWPKPLCDLVAHASLTRLTPESFRRPRQCTRDLASECRTSPGTGQLAATVHGRNWLHSIMAALRAAPPLRVS